MRKPDDPFHVVGHRRIVDGVPVRGETWFDVYVNNRPLLKVSMPMSRREATELCAMLNKSSRCRKWAGTLSKKTKAGVV